MTSFSFLGELSL